MLIPRTDYQGDLYAVRPNIHYLHLYPQHLAGSHVSPNTYEYEPPSMRYPDEESMLHYYHATTSPNDTVYHRSCGQCSADRDRSEDHRDSHHARDSPTASQPGLARPLYTTEARPLRTCSCSSEEHAENPSVAGEKPIRARSKWSKAGKALLKAAVAIGSVGGLAVTLWQVAESSSN